MDIKKLTDESNSKIRYNHVQVVPFSQEEKDIVTIASRLSETRRPVFFKKAILSFCEKTISDYQASLAPVFPSPEQEAGEASVSIDAKEVH